MTEKTDLYSMLPEELEEYFISIGEPKFRAKQIFPRFAAGDGIDELTNLSKALRARLKEETLDTLPRVEEKLVSKIDGTVKYLLGFMTAHALRAFLCAMSTETPFAYQVRSAVIWVANSVLPQ